MSCWNEGRITIGECCSFEGYLGVTGLSIRVLGLKLGGSIG